MKKYVSPSLEIIAFEIVDVIMTSSQGDVTDTPETLITCGEMVNNVKSGSINLYD